MYTHCIFHGVRWNSAAAVIVVAFLCYIYTHTHTHVRIVAANRAHTKTDILMAFRDAWTINENLQHSAHTFIHTNTHSATQTHSHAVYWWWKNLRAKRKKEKHFSNFIWEMVHKYTTLFVLYIEMERVRLEKRRNTYTEMSPLMMLLVSPKKLYRNWQIRTDSTKMSDQMESKFTNFAGNLQIQRSLKWFLIQLNVCLGLFLAIKHSQIMVVLKPLFVFGVRITWAWWYQHYGFVLLFPFWKNTQFSCENVHIHRSLSFAIFQFHLSNYPI